MTTTHIVILRTITTAEPGVPAEAFWDGIHYQTSDMAVTAGFRAGRSDDFNVGRVEGGRLVWFGWMDHEIPTDRVSVAHQIGLTA